LHVEEAATLVPNRIEREIQIDAPLEVVWDVLTEAEHIAGWFSDSAHIDLHPGGEAIFTWEEKGGTVHGRVETVDPPRFFSFRWIRAPDTELGEGNSTLVEFNLSEDGDGTRLQVVESGFAELEGPDDERAEYAEGHRTGWAHELDELREHVRRQAAGGSARR
jgi:uncharacterized protein YndB with AHSA1/START domain